jgi:PAS domain S-box-containing protein
MSSLRIVVVDDHEAIRRGIREVLAARPEWNICGEAANGVEAVEQAKSIRPDVVLMDVAMPRMDGLQATKIIRSQVPESQIIIVSQNERAIVARQAAEAGASGYVPKNELHVALVDTIDKIAKSRPVGNVRTGSLIDSPNSAVQPFRRNVDMPPSDAELGKFLERAMVALHWIAPDGVILWANQAELDLLDCARDDYVGRPSAEFYVDPARVEDLLERLNRGEAVRDFEARLKTKNGAIRNVLITASGVFESGKFLRGQILTFDIRERKLVEARLLESERRFREMIDALPAAIYTTDADGKLTHFNPASIEFSGRVPELGTDHWCVSWKLFNADGTAMPHDECPMAIALKEGRIVDGVEAIAERPDGSRVWFTPFPRALHDADGRIIGGINMLLDITSRKEAEGVGSHLAAIVDSSDDIIISKSLDGIISSWNKGAERMLGYTAEEAIGRHISLIVPYEYRDEEVTILERLKRGERVEHFETVRVAKDGTRLDLSLTISPVKDRRGRVIGASKVARNIGEKKRAERAFQESQEQLRAIAEGLEAQVRSRTRELEERNVEILQQSDQLRELSSRLLRAQDEEWRRIARELHDSAGQIVTALGMSLSSITAHAEKNPQISKALEHTKELVGQLSKEIRTMSYLLHPPLLDETGLAHAIRWYAQGLAERSDLRIQVDIPENFGRLSSDLELAMFRIVQECLTNIHRHSESKTAKIALSRNRETACLEIEDEGKGIPADKLAGIQTQRSGVGFSGMRERVRHLKGNFAIRSGGKGTKISVTFPVSESDEAEADRAATQSMKSESPAASGRIVVASTD